MDTQPIRVGILGAARIAPAAIIKPARGNDEVVLQAVAARNEARAQRFARKHWITHVSADYQALIERDDVDLIYNPLPPAMHFHWTLEALRAGKHVLCEKPFAMNREQAAEMVNEARRHNRHLIEAFHYRFHPLFDRILELLPEIGEIEHIDAEFSVPIPRRKGELRYDRSLGGGALMDLGCYPVHFARSILGEEPEVRSADADWVDSGVDLSMSLELEFPSGVSASLRCSMMNLKVPKIFARISGSKGTVRVINFVLPHAYHKIGLKTQAREWNGKVEGQSTYRHQLEHVVEVLRGTARAVTGGQDAIANMSVIDTAYRIARDRSEIPS